MKKKKRKTYLLYNSHKNFVKSCKRRENERLRRAGFKRFISLLRSQSNIHNIPFAPPKYEFYNSNEKRPEYEDLIKFLIPKYLEFSDEELPKVEDGILIVPDVFSLSENHEKSMFFLKRLFYVLLHQCSKTVIIDYKLCTYLDIEASACMDLILAGFINYYNKCIKNRHKLKIDKIKPINIDNKEVRNVLFSIGAYKNLKNFELKHQPDFIPLHLKIGDSQSDKKGRLKERHETQIVDYVLSCLEEMGHTLTAEAETNLSQVVGEVMANAEEHSKFRYRYAIGYFTKPTEINNHLGTFKLAIFNFGRTIYESFKNSDCKNFEVINQMKNLSDHFTKKGFFKSAQFEEQTLWTLYALQEGVTSLKDWNRGKGSIRFIDRFFKLKGDNRKDNFTKLTLISGNTRIIFDGTYPLKNVIRGKEKKPRQMMTFNSTGKIEEAPDDKFVNFTPHYFPGTLISAKICLTYRNIEQLINEENRNFTREVS